MDILIAALPELVGALGSAAIASTVVWCFRAWRRQRARDSTATTPATVTLPELLAHPQSTSETQSAKAKHYTLLGTSAGDGSPVQLTSTRPPGTIITWLTRGHRERFELTDVQLYDGTFAAEPVDRYEAAR
ncbi:hypothetical protein [Streptomyces sp. NPDC088400]|uniref:hypothetical protein n=1 Tax=Streptomyces sp. NPDC088400 TaxID=3365861 RepID=UPI003824D690